MIDPKGRVLECRSAFKQHVGLKPDLRALGVFVGRDSSRHVGLKPDGLMDNLS
jgi:hypothetical protein